MNKPIYTYTHAEYAALEAEIERLRAERDNLLSVLSGIGEVARLAEMVSGKALTEYLQERLPQYKAGTK